MADFVEEFKVDGYKVMVFDNVMPDHVIDQWLEARNNTITFKPTAFDETITGPEKQWYMPKFKVSPIDNDTRNSVFDWESGWPLEVFKKWDIRTTPDHFNRSFINRYVKGDNIPTHPDLWPDQVPRPNFYNVGILFLTPDEENSDPSDNGFIVRSTKTGANLDIDFRLAEHTEYDIHIDNKFNRLIMMDARIHHRPNIPSDDFERLTFYIGYTNNKNNSSYHYSDSETEKTLIDERKVPGTTYKFKN